ncbi:hypothetical protein PV797_13865 [Clostridiaceae bacterium M8S5]|nr:hypothetical protein PV797_13865 [Clostridiaceae bacterium M8S5]
MSKIDKFYKIYFIVGVLLVISCFVTSNKGLDKKNYELYKYSKEIESIVEEKVWKGLRISDYPVAIKAQDMEYVFYNEEIKKRKEILPVLAATAYRVDGKMNVLVPSYDELGNVKEFVEGIGDESKMIKNSFGFSESNMTDEEYIAILYHEAFHAYQFTHFKKLEETEIKLDEALMIKIKQDEVLSKYTKEEGETLYNALTAKTSELCLINARRYIQIRNKRNKYLESNLTKEECKQLVNSEDFYELIEGTAYYVQLKVLEILADKENYDQAIKDTKELGCSKHKYYESGMAMLLISHKLGLKITDEIFMMEGSLYDKFASLINNI